MGVAFDRHELRHAHRTGTGDAADVIAQEVDEHQVLRLLLRIARKFAGPGEVRRFVGAARTRAGDRPGGDAAARDLDEELGRTAGEGNAGQAHEAHIGRRIGGTQRLVGAERIDRRDFEPRGEIDLIRVARGDVFLAAADRADEAGFVERHHERERRRDRRRQRRRGRGARGGPTRRQFEGAAAGGAEGRVRRADGTEHDDRQLLLRGVEDAGLVGFQESGERHADVGRSGTHRLELRRQLVAQQREEAALEGGPAGETRRADLARPAAQISERLLRGFLVRAVLGVEHHPSVGEEERRARGGRDRDREAARAAALEHRMVASREEGLPGGRQTIGAEAREVRQVRPTGAGGGPIGGRHLGDDDGRITHRRSSVCSPRSRDPKGSRPRVPP